MRCRRCSHELSSGADRCLRCFALNPQNVAGPLFAGLDSDPPKEVRVRFDDEPGPRERPPPVEKKTTAPSPPPKARRPPAPRPPPPPPLPFVDLAKTPAPPPRLEPVHPAPDEPPPPARRFDPKIFLFAWAIDFGAVAFLTVLHAGLAAAVIGPERLAPGPVGSIDYWFDLFRGGGLWVFWVVLAATLALAYCAFSALLPGRTPGLALATLPPRESRLPPESSAP